MNSRVWWWLSRKLFSLSSRLCFLLMPFSEVFTLVDDWSNNGVDWWQVVFIKYEFNVVEQMRVWDLRKISNRETSGLISAEIDTVGKETWRWKNCLLFGQIQRLQMMFKKATVFKSFPGGFHSNFLWISHVVSFHEVKFMFSLLMFALHTFPRRWQQKLFMSPSTHYTFLWISVRENSFLPYFITVNTHIGEHKNLAKLGDVEHHGKC